MIRDEKRLASLLDTTRRFMNDVAIPNEERVERENAIPEEIVARMRSLGFFGWSIPEDYGGAGLTTDPVGGTPEQFGAFIRADIDKWTRLINARSIKPD